MDGTVVAPEDVPVDVQPALVASVEGFREDCRGGVAGVVDPGVTLGQLEVDEAPAVVGADDVAGIGVPVDDLPG